MSSKSSHIAMMLSENKKVQKFIASDRSARKRLHSALEFVRSFNSNHHQNRDGHNNIDPNLEYFWNEYASLVFSVISLSISDLEHAYLPAPNAFGIMKTRTFDLASEDWSDLFEILDLFMITNRHLITRGWQQSGFLGILGKFLQLDNQPSLRERGFRCAVLYAEIVATELGARGKHVDLVYDAIDFAPFAGPNAKLPNKRQGSGQNYTTGWERSNFGGHAEMETPPEEPVSMLKFLLDNSIDTKPWMVDWTIGTNNAKTKDLESEQAYLDKLQFPEYWGKQGMFRFWFDVLAQRFFSLFYPGICAEIQLRREDSEVSYGFFHHCPGSFQRLIARWIYKFKGLDDYTQVLFENRVYVSIILESLRQRFIYRDAELVLDALRVYSGWTRVLPHVSSVTQTSDVLAASLSHLTLAFVSIANAHFDEPTGVDIVTQSAAYLEELANLDLVSTHEATYRVLRSSIIEIFETTYVKETTHVMSRTCPRLVQVMFHIWTYPFHHQVVREEGSQRSMMTHRHSLAVWNELTTAIHRWMCLPLEHNRVLSTITSRWKDEIIVASRLTLMNMSPALPSDYFFRMVVGSSSSSLSSSGDDSIDGEDTTTGIPTTPPGENNNPEHSRSSEVPTLPEVGPRPMTNNNNNNNNTRERLMAEYKMFSVDSCFILLDRVLHLIPPHVMHDLVRVRHPLSHLEILDSIADVLGFWRDAAILPDSGHTKDVSDKRTLETLKMISPSTLLALYGEWFLPSCALKTDEVPAFLPNRAKAISILCQVCIVRCEACLKPQHVVKLCRVLIAGLRSKERELVSPILHHSSVLLNLDIPGLNVIVPVLITSVQEWLRLSALSQADLKSILGLIFAITTFTTKYPHMVTCLEMLMGRVDWDPRQHRRLGHGLASASGLATNLTEHLTEHNLEMEHALGYETHFATYFGPDPKDLDSTPSIRRNFGKILTKFIDIRLKDTTIKNMSLWGLYLLLMVELRYVVRIESTAKSVDVSVSKESIQTWMYTLTDSCGHAEYTIAIPALEAMASLSDSSEDLMLALNAKFLPQILMTLSVLAQEQLEKASTEIQHLLQNNMSASASSNLNLIAKKTAMIFDVMRLWLMRDTQKNILDNDKLCRMIFSAVEIALIGLLPSGTWEDKLQKQHQRRGTTANANNLNTLLLGLKMRSALEREGKYDCLKCFHDVADACEMFVLHLLHHYHAYPRSCVHEELDTLESLPSVKSDSIQMLHYVYQKSMIFTYVGSLDSQEMKVIVRDAAGCFAFTTQAITPIPKKAFSRRSDTQEWLESQYEIQSSVDKHEDVDPIFLTRPFILTQRAGIQVTTVVEPAAASSSKRKGSSSSKPVATATSTLRLQVSQDQHKSSEFDSSLPFSAVMEKEELDGLVFHTAEEVQKQEKADAAEAKRFSKQQEEDDLQDNDVEKNELSDVDTKAKKTHKTKDEDEGTRFLNIAGLIQMSPDQAGVGCLDGESSLLDILMDGLPIVYTSCRGETYDHSLLGGIQTLKQYSNHEDQVTQPQTTLTHWSGMSQPGLSFFHRILNDDEVFPRFKQFVMSESKSSSKDPQTLKYVMDFCDAVKRFEKETSTAGRKRQGSVMYWEFLRKDGSKVLDLLLPSEIINQVQHELQQDHVSVQTFEASIRWLDKYLREPFLISFIKQADDLSSPAPSQVHRFERYHQMEERMDVYGHILSQCTSRPSQLGLASLPPRTGGNGGSSSDSPSSETPTRVSPLDICRLFMSQMNWILPDQEAHIHMIDASNVSKFQRSIKHLDKSPARETMKIAIIYVAPGQSKQQDILANESGTPAYLAFCRAIGYEIDLLNHEAGQNHYVGGLDTKSGSNGPKALYYADSSTEVIFHTATMMPTKIGDHQQIDKKRHVGNDFVHIVWNDNRRDYAPATISSQFNDVHVVIHPLARAHESLYRVKIFSKKGIPVFGPLMSDMIVDGSVLPLLVRQTAMNAHRLCRARAPAYLSPHLTRKKLIEEIDDRYAVDYDESTFVMALLSTSSSSARSSTKTSGEER